MSISDSTRKELALLARRKSARIVKWSPGSPIDWHPGSVRNPNGILDSYFTDASAWELVASELEAGRDVKTIVLKKPPGATAYVVLIELEPGERPLYIKVQLGAGTIIGRSFHYSNRK